MKKILFLMVAVIMTAVFAAGCSDDSNNSNNTPAVNTNDYSGAYTIDSLSVLGQTIPQTNATVRINSQDNQSVYALILGFSSPGTTDLSSNIIYWEKMNAFNIRNENGKYILPMKFFVEAQPIEIEFVMTKVESYPENTGIGTLRDIIKLTANNGQPISVNNGTMSFNVVVETNSTASDFDFKMAEVEMIADGVYALGSTTTDTDITTPENGSIGSDSVSEGFITTDITYELVSSENNKKEYKINVTNPVDQDAAYILSVAEKNAVEQPNNATMTLVKQTIATTAN